MAQQVKNLPAMQEMQETRVQPRVGKIPRGGNGNPLRYSYWESPMDRGGCQAMVHWITKSQTQLKQLSMHGLYTAWIIHCLDYTLHVCAILLWRMHVSTIMGIIHSASNFLYLCLLSTPDYRFDLSPKASRVHSAYVGLCQWGCVWGELQDGWFFKDYVLAPGQRPSNCCNPKKSEASINHPDVGEMLKQGYCFLPPQRENKWF